MFNVMIIDDEIQIRKGLRMKIDWENEGFSIVAEASNGQDGLEKLKYHDVDLVISDVRMPIMDGIDFASASRMEYDNLKVVILSGYSDFEYAKSSMKAGVKDYLLKPVAPDELSDTLKKIRLELESDQLEKLKEEQLDRLMSSQVEEMREKYMLSLVKEEIANSDKAIERLQQLKLDSFAKSNVAVQFIAVENRKNDEADSYSQSSLRNFQTVCKELTKEEEGTFSFYDGSYPNMIHFIKCVGIEETKKLSSFVADIQTSVKKELGLETVVGIGRKVSGPEEFKNGYISALLSWSQCHMGLQSQVIEVADKNEVFNFSLEFEMRMTNSIEHIDFKAFENHIRESLNRNNQSMMSFSFVANRILFLLGALAKKYDITTPEVKQMIWHGQQTIWELTSQKKVIKQLIQLGNTIMKEIEQVRSSSGGAQLVENVQIYLEKHYADEISLSVLSSIFHINSAYLSEIFKAHAGQNFSDYLNQLRMKRASELLKDPHLKIIDVAHLVGFSNSGYFSTVFKKYSGITPAEFRNNEIK